MFPCCRLNHNEHAAGLLIWNVFITQHIGQRQQMLAR